MNYRKCTVKGEKALFHMWIQHSNILKPDIAAGGHNGGTVSFVRGLIETEHGNMKEVLPKDIHFIDNLVGDMHSENEPTELIYPNEKER